MAKDIVDVAIGELGYKEQGNNRTKYGAWYGMNGAAWCHMFVSWCAYKAGVSVSIVPKTASTSAGMAWFKKKGLFRYKGRYTPKRGDIVYFKTNRSHVGIVEKVSGSTLHTIEGNTSDKVARRTYPLSNATITGYGVPKYPTKTTTKKTKSSKKELAGLKKILKEKETTQKKISADIKETTKLPEGIVTITVVNGNKRYDIPALEGASITWERSGTPGKLTFETKYKKKYKIVEGNSVLVTVDKKKIFYGFIFTRSFKKDMNCGKLANTGYRMSAIEDNTTLFDIIQNSLDDTVLSTGMVYVLFDEVGKLRLKKISDMKVNGCLIDKETGEEFSYQTSIDSDVYNQIKLIYENKDNKKKKGTYDLYVTKNSKSINRWGVLQYVEKINTPKLGKQKSAVLLKIYNKKQKTLSISGVIGNTNVRAGSLVPVMLELGDMKVSNYMLVEKVTHKFNNRQYTMDLVVSGGGFVSG